MGGMLVKEKVDEEIEKRDVEAKNKSFFNKKYTNIAKGIAVLLLLFHHLGLNPELGLFRNSTLINITATQCKVCVSIFLILSGYGLNASLNHKNCTKIKDTIKFSLKHLLKMMLGYWLIFSIFMAIGCATGLRTIEVYGENKFLNMFIDFMGLANLFSTPTYNATWWFMSLIIILYLIFPILKLLLKRSPIAFILVTMGIRIFGLLKFYTSLNQYLIVFCLGMLFSEFEIFDKLRNLNKTRIGEIIITIMFLCFGLYARYKFGGLYDIVAAFAIIFVSNNVLANIKGVNNILELLGKHSANIFMFHTFIYKYFFNNLMAKLKYCILMYIVLVISTLIISMLIEKGKKLIKITAEKIKNDKLTNRFIKER